MVSLPAPHSVSEMGGSHRVWVLHSLTVCGALLNCSIFLTQQI